MHLEMSARQLFRVQYKVYILQCEVQCCIVILNNIVGDLLLNRKGCVKTLFVLCLFVTMKIGDLLLTSHQIQKQ